MTDTILASGSRAKVNPDAPVDNSGNWDYYPGQEFVVDDYVSGDDSDINGIAFYWGNSEHGHSDVAVPAQHVTLLLTPEQMDARELPKVEVLVRHAANGVMDFHDAFDINEVDWQQAEDGYLIAEGKTSEGLRFSFKVTVTDIERTDF